MHEAVVPWVEDIRDNNFTVCVTQAGRNEKKNGQAFATVDWLAYQGAPDGGVSGEMDMPTWWTGTNCRTVSLPPVRFPGNGNIGCYKVITIIIRNSQIPYRNDEKCITIISISSVQV